MWKTEFCKNGVGIHFGHKYVQILKVFAKIWDGFGVGDWLGSSRECFCKKNFADAKRTVANK